MNILVDESHSDDLVVLIDTDENSLVLFSSMLSVFFSNNLAPYSFCSENKDSKREIRFKKDKSNEFSVYDQFHDIETILREYSRAVISFKQ